MSKDGLVERFTRTTRALGIVAAFARPLCCAAETGRGVGRPGSLAGVMASGCHDPSGTHRSCIFHPCRRSVSCQSSQSSCKPPSSLLLSLFLLASRPLVTHARTPHSHHPPTAPHANIHCTSLACATPVGPATSEHFHFWAAARDQANHRLQISRWTNERCSITCPLTSARTLHCHLIAHASFQP